MLARVVEQDQLVGLHLDRPPVAVDVTEPGGPAGLGDSLVDLDLTSLIMSAFGPRQ